MKTSDPIVSSLTDGSIAHSKFEPYSPGVDLVERHNLLDLLDQAATRKLGLVVAPAGFGKSILIGQWVSRQQSTVRCCAWLTLDAAETDGVQFLGYLVLALGRAGVAIGELESAAHAGLLDAPIASVLAKLIVLLRAHPTPIVLVLEDYHHAESTVVNTIVAHLLRETDDDFVVFLDSRELPDLDTSSRIAAGEAAQIGPDQLRLSESEVARVLDGLASTEEARIIHHQTEGWPVAIQLVAATKRTQPDLSVHEGLSGGLIASYLTEQIISQMHPNTRSFLLTLALLERFNYDLADYAHQVSNSRSLLGELAPVRALLIRSTGPDEWMRLHHLFAEHLQELAVREDPALVNAVYLHASRWFEEHGLVVEAVKYAQKANDFDACQRIILDAGGWRIILTQGIGVLRNALSLLPDALLQTYPRLGLARAYLHCKHGEIYEARALLNAAIGVLEGAARPKDAAVIAASETDRLIVESMIRIYEDHTVLTEGYRRLRQKYQTDEGLKPLDMGTLQCEVFVEALSSGSLGADAEQLLRNAFASMRESGSVLGLNYCYLHAAHLALMRGEFDLGVANVDRALQMAEENFGSDSGLKYLAVLLRSTLRVWQGKANITDTDELQAALRHTIEYDGWAEIYLVGYGAVVMLARQTGSYDSLRSITNELMVFSKQRGMQRLTAFIEQHLPEVDADSAQQVAPLPTEPTDAETEPRYWQARATRARLGFANENPVRPFATTLSTTRGLSASPIYSIYLMVSYAVSCAGREDSAAGLDLLADAVELAIPQRILGPFLVAPELVVLLRGLRDRFLHDEQKLIALQFVEKALGRCAELRPDQLPAIFSPREMDVLSKLLMGLSNKEIARALELTENTVKFHLKKIFSKLDVKRRTQAITRAQELGLTSTGGGVL